MSDGPVTSSPQLPNRLIPLGFGEPFVARAKGATVWDEAGNEYLDLDAGPGVLSVGHCHPRVVTAIKDQSELLLQAPGHYFTRAMLSLAERLSNLTGGRLTRAFFANSGAEANDGAIKAVLKRSVANGKSAVGILALEHGFHGRTSLPLALTGMSGSKHGMGSYGTFPGVVHVASPYCYRCPLGLTYPSCGIKCASEVEAALDTRVPGDAAALIGEPVLGVGGVIVPPKEYWPKVEAICKSRDIALVHDEVFTGFGRTGKMFGHEHWGTHPDVMTFAKALGGGVPFGGFIATEEIGSLFAPGEHYSTFGINNQLGVHAALAVLDVIDEERLPERAQELGDYFLTELRGLGSRHEVIGDVRGLGLMIGIELVKSRETKEPAKEAAMVVREEMRRRGILLVLTGMRGNVVRLTPPLVISKEQIDRALAALDDVFDATERLGAMSDGAR